MKLRNIFFDIRKKFNVDFVLIQDTRDQFQIYGDGLGHLMGELGLKRKLLADEGPLKINSRHVRDLESHL